MPGSRADFRAAVVPDGPRFHQQRVLRFGPLRSLLVPALAGAAALVLLTGSDSTWKGILGFTAALVAVPTLPAVGLPVADGGARWFVAVASSLILWLFLGHVAARRSTRKMASTWPEWRQEWLRLALGAWTGALIGIGIAGAYFVLMV